MVTQPGAAAALAQTVQTPYRLAAWREAQRPQRSRCVHAGYIGTDKVRCNRGRQSAAACRHPYPATKLLVDPRLLKPFPSSSHAGNDASRSGCISVLMQVPLLPAALPTAKSSTLVRPTSPMQTFPWMPTGEPTTWARGAARWPTASCRSAPRSGRSCWPSTCSRRHRGAASSCWRAAAAF